MAPVCHGPHRLRCRNTVGALSPAARWPIRMPSWRLLAPSRTHGDRKAAELSPLFPGAKPSPWAVNQLRDISVKYPSLCLRPPRSIPPSGARRARGAKALGAQAQGRRADCDARPRLDRASNATSPSPCSKRPRARPRKNAQQGSRLIRIQGAWLQRCGGADVSPQAD